MSKIINLRITFRIISRNLLVMAAALLVCAGVALIYSEDIMPFIITSGISLLLALILNFSKHKISDSEKFSRKDAYLTVTSSWVIICLIGSLPYIFSGAIPSYVNALFESVSGFTTTGSSILTDIESLPKSLLFWRSLTHWIGGIGIIVLVIIIMPSLRISGYHLFTQESSLQEKIQPRVRSVGSSLLKIYILLTVLEIILLMAGNMNFFDSVCHSFGTVATGGFSPKNTSIAEYSPYIQYIIMLFMLLAGMNFLIHFYLFKRDFRKIAKNDELKFYLTTIAVIGLTLTIGLSVSMNKPVEEAFRESFFQIISIITCTGFATADYLLWPEYAWMIIFFAMFLGGSTGSTAGGIKMARHLVLIKNIKILFRKQISPHAVMQVRLNNNRLSDEANNSILTFISVYFLIFVAGTLLLVFLGIDGSTASSSVATCMAGIGPGIGSVGPAGNFAHLPEAGKVTLLMLMIIGRLEIYTVIMLFSKTFWRN
ncbi:MAG: potassium transporter [Bacteroidetes bacterium HGW-Bacteroidetes-11]|nr:MAG: potassium transporter [Bacteroidetes bacterium HGW-Bacteroidetes-11]